MSGNQGVEIKMAPLAINPSGSPGELVLPVTSTLIKTGLEVLFPMGETVRQQVQQGFY